jgi:hypothetical protein
LPLFALQPAHHGFALAEIRVSKTESRLAAYLNRLLQQNRHEADIHAVMAIVH